jgi:hypothetical protein
MAGGAATRSSIGEMAARVIQSDVSSQQAIGTWAKGVVTTRTAVPAWYQPAPVATTGSSFIRTLITGLVIIATGVIGIGTGYIVFTGQPTPSQVAVVPTPTASPSSVTASPVVATATPVTATPVVSTPTQSPVTATPVVTTPAPTASPALVVTGLDTVVEVIPVENISTYAGGPSMTAETPGDPLPAGAPGSVELTGLAVGNASLDAAALAALGGFLAQNPVAVIEERWPCGADGVFCGIQELEPGDYYVIGFGTAESPPMSGAVDIIHTYNVLTDLDGDWTNNGFVVPPRINNMFLSTQYAIEGGWYQEVGALGQTDYRGPIGPDGQTPRYNERAVSRLVLTQDPPGGFFLIPAEKLGPWFRLGALWQDFSGDGVVTAVDWISSDGGLSMTPTPGRATLPVTIDCGRVDLVAEPLGDQPVQLVAGVRFQPAVTLPAEPVFDVAIASQTQTGTATLENPDLPLVAQADGSFAVAIPVPGGAINSFASVVLRGAEGLPVDLTEEFIVLTGSGVAVPAGATGLVLGDAACAAGP